MFRYQKQVFLVVISYFLVFCSNAGDVEQTSRYYSMSIDGELSKGAKFSAAIQLDKVICKNYRSKKHLYGIDRPCPDTLIRKLEVKINNKVVDIPGAVFQDLADVSLPIGFYMMQLGEEVRLYVKGGDGIAAYTAGFYIVDGKLVARSIEELNQSGEMEKKISKF